MKHLAVRLRLVAALLLAALIVGAAGAATGPVRVYLPLAAKAIPQVRTLTPAAQLSGAVGPSAASGSHIYLVTGPGLEILDATSTPPRLVGSVNLPMAPLSVAAIVPAGQLLYVLANITDGTSVERAILAYDLAIPAQPRLVATTRYGETWGSVDGAVVGADRLTVSAYPAMLVFDLSTPAAPRLAARMNNPDYARIAAYKRYLYVAGAPILNLNDPDNPLSVSRPLPNPVPTSNYRSNLVVGDVLYMLTAELRLIDGERCYDNRLQSYRLDDPTAPAAAGFVRFQATGPNVAGGRCNTLGIFAGAPGRIVLGLGNQLQIVDTSDPLAPRAGQLLNLSETETIQGDNQVDDALPSQSPWLFTPPGGAIAGAQLLLPRGGIRALLFDLADPGRVGVLPPYEPPVPAVITSVFKADGAHIVASDTRSFTLLNVANPAAPRVIGAKQRLSEASYGLSAAVVAGDRLYALEYDGAGSTLRIFTGVNGSTLRLAGILSFAQTQAISLAARGDYAYLGFFGAPLLVLAVADPAAPRVVRTLPFEGARNLALDGNLLRARVPLSDRDYADVTLSLADPANPFEVERTPVDPVWTDLPGNAPLVYQITFSPCSQLCVEQSLLLGERRPPQEPATRGSLTIVRSHPRATRFLRFSDVPGYIIYSASESCYFDPVTCLTVGELGIIDIRNPDEPAFFAHDATSYGPQEHQLLGRTIAAGYGLAGLILYSLPPELP